ncbi:MAG TPA: hypothetical protein VM325_01280 [Alphaproteobacteria bacterium]|nr:hypothetical protein [Alphaproteobacteria bacterium]
MTGVRSIKAAFAAFAVLLFAGTAAAQTIKDFEGHYVGVGVTRVKQSAGRVAARDRDLDVVIIAGPDGGFSLSWKTVFLYRWTKSEESKKRLSSLTFKPTGKPGIWRATRSGDPLAGRAMIWARLAGKVLSVYVVAADPGGGLVTAIYQRTLTKTGMQLRFSSQRDGKQLRTVDAVLRRAKAEKK